MTDIAYWGWRVVEKPGPDDGWADTLFVIEVYYNDKDEIVGWLTPDAPYGGTLEELRSELERYLLATQQPILRMEDLPGEDK